MRFSTAACAALVVALSVLDAEGFGGISNHAVTRSPPSWGTVRVAVNRQHVLCAKKDDDNNDNNDETEENENPYADPNYPELEFVNYSDPNYVVDQGQVEDEYFQEESEDDTLEQIEEMREERRRRNDEFQFETYHSKVLKNGKSEYRGEWTIYRTSTFLNGMEDEVDANGMPRLVKAKSVLRTVSSGKKVKVETESDWRVDGERIEHVERIATEEETQGLLLSATDNNNDGSEEDDLAKLQQLQAEKEYHKKLVVDTNYCPTQMSSFDFRGQQGNMCVGNGYTVCHTVPLLPLSSEEDYHPSEDEHDGPFQEMRTEIGIQDDGKRFRIKLDYRIPSAGPNNDDKGDDDEAQKKAYDLDGEVPPLMLSSLTVCREALDRWPISTSPTVSADDDELDELMQNIDVALFGPPGASGGLYDPPPVGKDSQASQYMLIDLEGGATILFPYKLDQDPNAHDGKATSWVTSLDWSSGPMRYQVDRKVLADKKLKGLKTLEISEVRANDADMYRPKDGGADMRQ